MIYSDYYVNELLIIVHVWLQVCCGLLNRQITNQLVLAARDYIESSTTILEEDKLWTKVQEEIDSSSSHSAHLTKSKGKRKANKEILFGSDDGFLSRLNVCLSMHKQYRDMIRSLREGLGGSHSLSMTPSVLQPGGAKRSVITNSNSNLMSPIAAGSPIRLSFSQSRLRQNVFVCSSHKSLISGTTCCDAIFPLQIALIFLPCTFIYFCIRKHLYVSITLKILDMISVFGPRLKHTLQGTFCTSELCKLHYSIN